MPAKAQWLLRIPAIIDALAAVSVPVVDRTTVERLFGVGRRRAIDLMLLFEGYQTGSAFLLDRLSLIETLRRIAADPNIDYERRRRERLSAELDSARRLQVASRVRIAVRPGVQQRRVCDLPEGIDLRSGRLTIDFTGVDQLLSQLYELAQAAAYDYEVFCSAADPPSTGPSMHSERRF